MSPIVTMEELIVAAENADWKQVATNGGPPCFHYELNTQTFCFRAERWEGHSSGAHKYVSFPSLVRRLVGQHGR